jgi:chitodextrinase
MFCGESNMDYSSNKADKTCKHELATLFAHFAQETGGHDPNHATLEEWEQGLVHINEWKCTAWDSTVKGTATCDYSDADNTAYPPVSG